MVHCQNKPEEVFAPPTIEEPEEEVSVPDVEHYLTKENETELFDLQAGTISEFDENLSTAINIDLTAKFQEVEGFGFALTGGSAKHLSDMSESAKDDLLKELFGLGDNQIGMSFIRLSIGASDLSQKVFSYNDLEEGVTDELQLNFSIAPDEELLIPLLEEILLINADLSIMASPWSPPAWMKDNNSPKGGSLLKEYYDSYALYLMKYVQEMGDRGITIDYLTIQNEPLHDGNNPSMYMSAEDQRDFIKNSLGPLFEENQIQTKLVIYDHNADRPDYPITILDDPDARKYVDGSAFHLYGGDISTLSTVRNAHSDKNIYFTEQWYESPGNFDEDLKWHMREIIIGSQRNWSRSVIEWNLSSDPDLAPHTAGGCTQCLGGITLQNDIVKRNAGYYVIAHASKYVRPASVRVFSNYPGDLPNVAYLTPDQEVVLLVLNDSESIQNFNISDGTNEFSTSVDPGSVSTFVWSLN